LRPPKEWRSVRLRYVCEINPAARRVAGPIAFAPMDAVGVLGGIRFDQTLEQNDVSTGLSYFEEDDVIVAKITPCFENGKCALAENVPGGRALGSTEFHVIRPGSTVFPRFLFYAVASAAFREPGEAHMYGAAGQKRVPTDFIKEFLLSFPDNAAQRAIAAFLDVQTARIDSLMEKKQRLITLLDEELQALISRAVTRGLDPSALMKDSGVEWLGRVPANWRISRLKFAVAGMEQGWSPQCDSRAAEMEEWGVLKAGCVNGGRFEESENKVLPPDLEPDPRLEIRPGDVLMSRASGSVDLIGSVAIVPERCRARLILSDKLYRLAPQRRVIEPTYIPVLLGSSIARLQIKLAVSGASGLANNIAQPDVKDIILPVPPCSEQIVLLRSLASHTGKMETRRRAAEGTIALLREYRSALITAAVTGQLDLREHERKLEALA